MRGTSESIALQLLLGFTPSGLFVLGGCGSSESSKKDEEGGAVSVCTEPENPYSEGTGHYAGYEWAERHRSGPCNTSFLSFNEGCEEYENQESEYQGCESRQKH